jgi:hypothetical protein
MSALVELLFGPDCADLATNAGVDRERIDKTWTFDQGPDGAALNPGGSRESRESAQAIDGQGAS